MEVKDFLLFIGPLLGASVVWTLNRVGRWSDMWHEDKRKLKEVLFHLFEIYHLFSRSNFDKYVKIISDKVFQTLPKGQQTKETNDFLNQLYTNMAKDILKSELAEGLEKLEQNFQASIKTLASIDPLIAYRLNGKTSIFDAFEELESWIEKLKNSYPVDQHEIHHGAATAMDALRPVFLDDSLSDLENDIYEVAWKIGPSVWWESKNTISRIKNRTTNEVNKKIDELFNEVETMFRTLDVQLPIT